MAITLIGAVCATDGQADSLLTLERASFFGTSADDDIQGACAAPDGAIYIVGNTAGAMKKVPGGVQANAPGVYVAGYASVGLEQLLQDVSGLVKEYPLRKEVALVEDGEWREAVGEDTSKPDPIPESRHGQLGRYGAPCVLRLSGNLKTVECGTYLEGWQQVWAKDRTYVRIRDPKTKKKRFIYVPTEFSRQPTHLAVLKSGDVVICHDGGYFRLLTAEDRALVKKVGDPGLAKP